MPSAPPVDAAALPCVSTAAAATAPSAPPAGERRRRGGARRERRPRRHAERDDWRGDGGSRRGHVGRRRDQQAADVAVDRCRQGRAVPPEAKDTIAQKTCQYVFRLLFALEASGETIQATAWTHDIGKWREHRGSRAAGGQWRREATLTPPAKWVNLSCLVRDGIATGEAEAAHSARKVPQEHTSQAPASAGTDSGWTMPTTASGRSALRRRAKTCSTTRLFVSSVTRKRYHLYVKVYCTSPLLCKL